MLGIGILNLINLSYFLVPAKILKLGKQQWKNENKHKKYHLI